MRRVCAGLLVFVSTVLMLLSSLQALAAEGDFVAVPKLVKRVTDTTGTLSADDEAQIEARLKAFEAKKGAQIAVLIIETTQPEPVFDYATRVFTEWKLGRKGVDDGVLLLIAKNDRKMQILTGPGISGSLTDAMSKRIISEFIAPKFRTGDFAGGIDAGVGKMMGLIEGEALPPPPQKRVSTSHGGGGFENFVVLAILAAVFVGPLLRAILGRFLGAAATGGITGAAAWFIAGGLALPIVAGVLVFFAVLFLGAFRGFGGFGGGGGWSSGGGSWGGTGGGGGGFSGGGGSFDGGGASGDW
jgi:uncharacterized protein